MMLIFDGVKLRNARMKLGKGLRGVAEESNIHKDVWNRLELGKVRNPNEVTIKKLCRYFGEKPEVFFKEIDGLF